MGQENRIELAQVAGCLSAVINGQDMSGLFSSYKIMQASTREERIDFYPKMSKTDSGGRPPTDYDIFLDMAKQICMIQRTPEGKKCRQYLIDLEKARNTHGQVMARKGESKHETVEHD